MLIQTIKMYANVTPEMMIETTANYSMSMTSLPVNGTASQPLNFPQYYKPDYKIIGCFFVSSIFLVGFLGNLLVIFVIWRTRSMHTTTNCYLASLAVADILLLISAPLPTIIEYFLIIDQSMFGPVGCAIMVYCQYLGVNLSSLSITAFTVERYIAICHPMRAQTMCTPNRAKKIIFGLWTFGAAYCAPWLGLATTKVKIFSDGTQIEQCDFKLDRNYYLTYFMADLIIFYVIPLLLTCVLYGLIAYILRTSSSLGGRSGGHNSPTQATSNRQKSVATVSRSSKPTSTANSRIQVIKMLAVVVCVFAVLWLPYRAYVVYNSFASRRFKDLWFLLFCRLMVYTNSAINPILYNAMSIKFRRAFKRVLCCGRFETLNHNYYGVTSRSCTQQAQEPTMGRSADFEMKPAITKMQLE